MLRMPRVTLFHLFLLILKDVFGVDGDEVKSVSVMEGDSVTLHTDLTDIQREDQILWMFGSKETRIAEIHKKVIYMYNSNEIFRYRLMLDNQTGSLIITNIRITNSGLYKLVIISDRGNSYKRFNLTVYAPLPIPIITRNSSECSSSSDKCVVLCSVCNVSHVSLSWYKGMSLLSSISVSDLNIRLSLPLEVEYHHTNTYTCVLNNTAINHTQHIHNICEPCSGSTNRKGYLAGIIIAVLVSVLVSSLALAFFSHRKHKQDKLKGNRYQAPEHVVETTEDEVHYADATFHKPKTQTKTQSESETVYASIMT